MAHCLPSSAVTLMAEWTADTLVTTTRKAIAAAAHTSMTLLDNMPCFQMGDLSERMVIARKI